MTPLPGEGRTWGLTVGLGMKNPFSWENRGLGGGGGLRALINGASYAYSRG